MCVPVTGPAAEQGLWAQNGAKLALAAVNKAGGALGMRTMDTAIQQLLDSRQITGKEAFKKAINKSRFEEFRDPS